MRSKSRIFNLLAVALVVAAAFLFVNARKASAQGWSVPIKPTAWDLYGTWYHGSAHPKAASDGGVYFDFPQTFTGVFVGYFTAAPRTFISLSGTLSMTFTVTTTGSPIFNYMSEPTNTCPVPATVRPFFWGNGDVTNDGRWWSNPVSYVLESGPGTFTLTVPLTSDKWSDVNGRFGNRDAAELASFANALANINRVGMTFGGGCSFGHGVNVNGGTARFELQSYNIY